MKGILGWIGSWVAPLVESIAEWATPFIIGVVQALGPTILPIIKPIVESIVNVLEPVLPSLLKFFEPLIDPIGEATANGLLKGLENQFANYTPDNPNLSRFEPVVPESQQVQQTTVSDNNLTQGQLNEVRDAMVAARLGYSDYSDLRASGIVDAGGYVKNDAKLYNDALHQTGLPLQNKNWSVDEAKWGATEFDIIRVMEKSGPSAYGGYNANVALMKHNHTGEYFISVGGTNDISDVMTDLELVFRDDSGASRSAIRQMIDQMFAKDIPSGAVVNLAGHSLGGAEVVQQYHDTPNRFDKVFALNAVGTGGFDGTYYEQKVWDKRGDPNIIEIRGDDAGTDFNDLVVYWGYIGAGKVIDLGNIPNVGESEAFGPDLELLDSHLLGNMWAALPGSGQAGGASSNAVGQDGSAFIQQTVQHVSVADKDLNDRVAILNDYRETIGSVEKRGTDGADVIKGDGNASWLVGKGGNDRLVGNAGDDLLLGGDGKDHVNGGHGNDYLHGGNGADYINGGNDRDFIEGGLGDDKLRGGDGSDVFIFRDNDAKNRDVIVDFEMDDILLFSDEARRKDLDIKQVNGHTVIKYNDGDDKLVLLDFAMKHLDADNFLFG